MKLTIAGRFLPGRGADLVHQDAAVVRRAMGEIPIDPRRPL